MYAQQLFNAYPTIVGPITLYNLVSKTYIALTSISKTSALARSCHSEYELNNTIVQLLPNAVREITSAVIFCSLY
uniref:Uncharacterized protein n=1 Tax=Cucumis melo TaxID=3656 RepID=A0A9I9EDX0_CUCME